MGKDGSEVGEELGGLSPAVLVGTVFAPTGNLTLSTREGSIINPQGHE